MPPAGFAVTLPFSPGAARAARSMIGELLADQGCPLQLVDDGRLIAHELVVNGVTHGRPDARAEIAFSCQLLDDPRRDQPSTTRDSGDGWRSDELSADSPDGRGLAIVEALSDRWTVDRSEGTRVEAWLAR